MGCDIHPHVEYKFRGKWRCGDYFRMAAHSQTETKPIYTLIELCGDRNYALFATLANVRNYGNTAYIDEPRGLPSNASEFVKNDYHSCEDWAHSCSYVTLKELIDFHNQNHPLKRRGMISPEAQKRFDEGILPDTWCQSTNMEGYEWREWEEENDVLVPLIKKLKERADELNMIYSFYWDSDNPEYRKLAYEQASNIRFVFWFDN